MSRRIRSNTQGRGFYRVSKFDLTHERKGSYQFGKLYPVLVEEAMPGDTFSASCELQLRLMPMLAPMMHRCDVYIHYYFVPSRLLWNKWEDFITGGEDGQNNSALPTMQIPVVVGKDWQLGGLYDHLGLPMNNASAGQPALGQGKRFSALIPRAYSQIYNDWYRDQQFVNKITWDKDAEGDVSSEMATHKLMKRAWRKGYFEAALPWQQRGDPAQVPFAPNTRLEVYTKAGQKTRINVENNGVQNADLTASPNGLLPSNGNPAQLDYEMRAYAKADAGIMSVSDLRLAFQLQRFLEKNARGGARYIEWIKAHFGVTSSDARLQRAEYLGGGRLPIVIGEVMSTADTVGASAGPSAVAGWPNGRGDSVGGTPRWTRSMEEYGYVIGIMSILPKASYMQGLPRMFTRFGRYDQVLPVFAHVGDQGIKTTELYASAPEDEIFGYSPRFEEMRRRYDVAVGDMRGSLSYWHMAREFVSKPVLGQDFIECTPDYRPFLVLEPEVAGSDPSVVQMLHHIEVLRPLPKFGDPGLIDHN